MAVVASDRFRTSQPPLKLGIGKAEVGFHGYWLASRDHKLIELR
jgi:hypothetical protein